MVGHGRLAEARSFRAYRCFLLQLWTAGVGFTWNICRSYIFQRLWFIDSLIYVCIVIRAFSEADWSRQGRQSLLRLGSVEARLSYPRAWFLELWERLLEIICEGRNVSTKSMSDVLASSVDHLAVPMGFLTLRVNTVRQFLRDDLVLRRLHHERPTSETKWIEISGLSDACLEAGV